MARLVVKNGFIKGGSGKAAAHLDNLVKYIATRDGVEKVKSGHEHWRATKSQHELIAQIVREFPSTKESLEYEDYLAAPNRKNASEFITIALEQNLDKLGDRKKYLDYIANRPRVEKFDTHGLFTAGDTPLVLAEVAREVSEHQGNVWTPIISLRREDAETFGYESAFAWKALLSSKAMEIAESLKIHPDHLKWYAAFHNESHHPHVHMICYSTNPTEGYLNTNGIRKAKSARVHPAMMNAPDLSQWYFNKMCGLGDEEHNREVREAREAARPILSKSNVEIPLWNIWVYYAKDLQLKEDRQKSQALASQAGAIFSKKTMRKGGSNKIEE